MKYVTKHLAAAMGFALVAVAASSLAQDGASIDRAALRLLYESTDGANWTNNTNWGTDEKLASWFGVYANSSGRVYALQLSRNNLSGKIPAALGDLAELEILTLGGNELSGEIPPELGDLSALEELDLRNNELEGTIPSQLGGLPKLWLLYLHRNSLTGGIPPELGNLPALAWLGLDNNSLTGEIPPELGNLSTLQKLFLHHNSLTGEIPDELGNLSALETLYLGFNSLTGEIPQALGYLLKLREIELRGNRLTGGIPQNLGYLLELERLHLSENGLTGVVPDTLLWLTSLKSFYWHSYELEGLCVPDTDAFRSWLDGIQGFGPLCSDPDRRALSVLYDVANGANWKKNTNWKTDVPLDEWYGVKVDAVGRVKSLNLQKNKLSGLLPRELGRMRSLTRLNLQRNRLEGAVPEDFLDLSLRTFRWSRNASLCVPDTEDFRDWVARIKSKQGPVCAD